METCSTTPVRPSGRFGTGCGSSAPGSGGRWRATVRSRDTAKYLQEQVITDRNGRYVLLVRAEHRSAIPGIVHGSSSSGASLFLEPLSTVEINNDVVALLEQETEEVHRILLELTEAFRARRDDLDRTLRVAAELDEVQAKARFARLCDGIAPALSDDGRLELLAARHPLLIPAVDARVPREDGERHAPREAGPVPVDVTLIPPTSVLVITGPNTGGKTVAIKTAGLLALMAQAGLHLPVAEGSRLPVFQSVFADIGDEQSIAANLSTFSWHVTNIASIDSALTLPALVLMDEVGSGTDPVEGGALGMAVIDHFRLRGALVVATTHYDTLKTYASTTEGVACAAFGFTPAFEPTYRLIYGSPGTSLALEMAEPAGADAVDYRQGAVVPQRTRVPVGGAPGEGRQGAAPTGPRAAPGRARARGDGRTGSPPPQSRGNAPPEGGPVPPPARGATGGPAARGAA